jgi:hypothetical protein
MRLEADNSAERAIKQAVLDTAEENRLLAKERRAEKRLAQLREKATQAWEVDNLLKSSVLSEYNHGRRRRDGYKGMSHEEVHSINQFNAQQREEMKENRRRAKNMDRDWQENTRVMNTMIEQAEAEVEEERRNERYQLKNDHIVQRQQHRQSERFLKQQIGTNRVTKDYYKQFGSNCTCPHN